jgi:hypothetical protein
MSTRGGSVGLCNANNIRDSGDNILCTTRGRLRHTDRQAQGPGHAELPLVPTLTLGNAGDGHNNHNNHGDKLG